MLTACASVELTVVGMLTVMEKENIGMFLEREEAFNLVCFIAEGYWLGPVLKLGTRGVGLFNAQSILLASSWSGKHGSHTP